MRMESVDPIQHLILVARGENANIQRHVLMVNVSMSVLCIKIVKVARENVKITDAHVVQNRGVPIDQNATTKETHAKDLII